jgi:uncharacterized protein
MSPDPFPERIDAVKLFARNGAIKAALPLARLQRLTASLSDSHAEVAVDLQFGLDEEGRGLLRGTLDVPVTVVCQRCLQPMPLQLHSTLALLVVEDDAALQELEADEDAVALCEGQLDLPALIEDELILSLPLVPLHEDTNCNAVLAAFREVGSSPEARPNPFAVLAGLTGQAAKQDKNGKNGKNAKKDQQDN